MPRYPTVYKSRTEAKDAFIRDVQRHRNYIKDAFNKYGKPFCELIGADVDDVEQRVIMHDISKYHEEVEVKGLMAYYYRYPNDGLEIDSPRRKYLFEKAMLNHYHMNSCHPEYWIQYKTDSVTGDKLFALDMDNEAVVEMVLDWIAIGMEPDFVRADEYWHHNRTKRLMSDDTIKKVDLLIDKYEELVNSEESSS